MSGLGAGCASLSLFSSQHYHGTPEIEQRLTCLENRMTTVETGVPSGPSHPLPERAPSVEVR